MRHIFERQRNKSRCICPPSSTIFQVVHGRQQLRFTGSSLAEAVLRVHQDVISVHVGCQLAADDALTKRVTHDRQVHVDGPSVG